MPGDLNVLGLAHIKDITEKTMAFVSSNPSIRPFSYIEVSGQTWTITNLDPFHLEEGKVSRLQSSDRAPIVALPGECLPENIPSILPWSQQKQLGTLAAAYKTVILGIFLPWRVLRITDSAPSGFSFYLCGLLCCLPVALFYGLALMLMQETPREYVTFLQVMGIQLVTAPIGLAIIGLSFWVGTNSVANRTAEHKRKLGWYIGTFLFVLFWWAYGVLLILGPIIGWDYIAPFILGGTILLFIRLAIVCIELSMGITASRAMRIFVLTICCQIVIGFLFGSIIGLVLR